MKLAPEVKTWYGMIATVGGVGTFSKMPGTLGTFVAFILLIAMKGVSIPLLAAVIVAGYFASDLYAKRTKKDDPQEVVIDEVAGYWISVVGLDVSYAIVGFFLFRIVDIVKPFPVRTMERLPGGAGIMADDILGGIMVNLLLRALTWLFFAGGMGILRGWLPFGG